MSTREKHLRSDFTCWEKGPPSAYVPGARQESVERMHCPSCREMVEPAKHGEPGRCPHCDLRWLAFGNSIELWRDS